MAESCGIPAGEVVRVLKYLHKNFGTVLYYNNVASLTDIVICDPNVIFKRATNLVALSFDERFCPGTSEDIRKSGEIDPCRMEKEKEKEKSPFSMRHVVDLLTHYNIISKIKKFGSSHVYFMPCLLLPAPIEKREEEQALHHHDPAPLLILFSTGYIPLGLFSALIVYLSQLDSWVLDPYKPRYRNKVPFIIDESTDLVLMSHINCLELRVQSLDSSTIATICRYIVHEVKEAIEYLKSCHTYMEFRNNLGFYCSSGLKVESGSPHPAICFKTGSPEACWDLESPKVMRCLHKPNCATSKLLDKHKVWFKQRSGVSADDDKAAGLLPQQPPVPYIKTAHHLSTDGKVEAGSKRRHNDPETPKEKLITEKFKEDQEMPEESIDGSVSLASSSSSVALHESETSDTVLGIDDMNDVMKALSRFTEWKKLGLSLGLSPGSLEEIECNKTSAYDRLYEVLKAWLQRNYKTDKYGLPTWNCLAKVLQEDNIDCALADKIRKKYCKM